MIDPIYGGVSASLAMLGDINIAEPDALVGFWLEDVLLNKLLELIFLMIFRSLNSFLKNGAIDMIVHRRDMRTKVHSLLKKDI